MVANAWAHRRSDARNRYSRQASATHSVGLDLEGGKRTFNAAVRRILETDTFGVASHEKARLTPNYRYREFDAEVGHPGAQRLWLPDDSA
jgi:hypothetical protein